MKIERMEPKALARKLQDRLEGFKRPMSLDAAHALMLSHEDPDVRREYDGLKKWVEERNANRDTLRSNPRIQAIEVNVAHSAIRYLLSFARTYRYDEKTQKIQRTSD